MTHKNAKYHDDEDYYYMVKDEVTTTKYLIHSQINAKGFVEKPDVVGAIFGQTEGLHLLLEVTFKIKFLPRLSYKRTGLYLAPFPLSPSLNTCTGEN